MSVGTNGTLRRIVSQQSLAVYRERRKQAAELNRWLSEERERIIHLVEADTPVERGPLRVQIKLRRDRRVTKASLILLIVENEYENLRIKVAPTESKQLSIEENRIWRGAAAHDRRSDQPPLASDEPYR